VPASHPSSVAQLAVIVDPDQDFLQWAERHLQAPSLEIVTTTDPAAAIKIFIERQGDLLLAELRMAPVDGIEVLKRVRQQLPNATVILNGNLTSTNAVIEAMRHGAFDVLRRESLSFELKPAAERGLQAAEQMKLAASKPKAPVSKISSANADLIIGRSQAMQDVIKLIGRVARADVPVLITGESGVGKEVVANATHRFSRRATGEYVAINCAAIPANLLESELFGHEKGAFTGAVTQRQGRFEQCDGGTLFLDEIGEMALEVQSKLLRVLQSGEFSRVGGNTTLRTNVRILAATNRHLETEVEHGRFREDLFYRLNVVRIHIPPLRNRREDVPLLVDHFLGRFAESGASRRVTVSAEAMEVLLNHDWPGNVRELENTLQRACVLTTGNVLLPQDLPVGGVPRKHRSQDPDPAVTVSSPAAAAAAFLDAEDGEGTPLERAERAVLEEALRRSEGDQKAACRLLGMTAAALRKKIDQHGLSPSGTGN